MDTGELRFRFDSPPWIVDEHGCWVWQMALDRQGYGRVRRDGRNFGAHRWVYSVLVGPVPEGYDLDHLCRNPRCVNPTHLEPVTHRENLRRGAGYGGKETCGKGHRAFVRSRSGKRYCVECAREQAVRYRERRNELQRKRRADRSR